MPTKPKQEATQNFRKYVTETVRKQNKDANLWINLGKRSSAEVQTIVKYFGTGSPKEIAQIVVGLVSDLSSHKLDIVEPAPKASA